MSDNLSFLFQVDLGILHRVSAIVTVGCFPIYHLMTDFLLEYAGLDKNWTLLPSSDPAVNMVSGWLLLQTKFYLHNLKPHMGLSDRGVHTELEYSLNNSIKGYLGCNIRVICSVYILSVFLIFTLP